MNSASWTAGLAASFSVNGTTSGVVGFAQSAPAAADYTVAMMMQGISAAEGLYTGAGWMASDGTMMVLLLSDIETGCIWAVYQYSAPGFQVQRLAEGVLNCQAKDLWIGLNIETVDTATFQASADGVNFLNLWQVTGYSYITDYSNIFWGMYFNGGSAGAMMTLRCYDPNGAARTFPSGT